LAGLLHLFWRTCWHWHHFSWWFLSLF